MHDDIDKSSQVPRVALLGFCERATQVTAGHIALWHTNIMRLSKSRVSLIYPNNIRGTKLALAIYEPRVSEEIKILFRSPRTSHWFDLTFKVSEAVSIQGGIETNSLTKLKEGDKLDGWGFQVVPISVDILIREPDRYMAYWVDSGKELYVNSLDFTTALAAPLTAEEIAAIRSNPNAMEAVRIRIACKECGSALQVYTGIHKSEKLEGEGWVWYENVSDRFRCRCGKTDLSMQSIKTNFQGMLRLTFAPGEELLCDHLRLYQDSALQEISREFLQLLASNPREEEMQKFLESHPILLCNFIPLKLMAKKPVLAKYVVDFAILSERNELLLVEIEKPDMKLLKKDGGIRAELQHALDQVRSWIQVFEDHKAAALEAFGLKLEDVAKISGVVIAGRTPKDEASIRRLRGLSLGDTTVYTYDDLSQGLNKFIKHASID